jgi:hypothetical protein
MNMTSRVFVALGAVTLMTYGSALAQQAPAQPPQAPAPPAVSPAAPAAAPAQAQAQALTASGDLVSVDAKEQTLAVKTSTGEMTFKYNDETKITGSSKGAAGLATMTGSEVTIRYRKDGASNIATSIDVKAAAAPRP